MNAETESGHAKPHKAPNYYLIWAYLGILTAVEMLVAFVSHFPKTILIVALMFLALWKALLVALYYMHLKFEPKTLWIVAAVPLPLILILLGAVLSEAW